MQRFERTKHVAYDSNDPSVTGADPCMIGAIAATRTRMQKSAVPRQFAAEVDRALRGTAADHKLGDLEVTAVSAKDASLLRRPANAVADLRWADKRKCLQAAERARSGTEHGRSPSDRIRDSGCRRGGTPKAS
jgi:hypothetical protein